jgi:hypothetical protein
VGAAAVAVPAERLLEVFDDVPAASATRPVALDALLDACIEIRPVRTNTPPMLAAAVTRRAFWAGWRRLPAGRAAAAPRRACNAARRSSALIGVVLRLLLALIVDSLVLVDPFGSDVHRMGDEGESPT